MIEEKELLDFHNFVIHDQLKHFTLVESRDDRYGSTKIYLIEIFFFSIYGT